MRSYQEANEVLGKRESRKLENNTYLQRREGGAIAVRLHETDVVTYLPDGKIRLNSGGWRTVTTKDRLNKYAPVHLFQNKGQWFIGQWRNPEAIYQDNMTINPDNTLVGTLSIKQAAQEQKLRAQVRKYAKDFVRALQAGKVPLPSGGDCWGCCMRDVKTGKTVMGHDHIRQHLKERYYVPSLAVNALEQMGASIAAKSTLFHFMGHPEAGNWGDFAIEQIEKTIKRYVYRELGLAY